MTDDGPAILVTGGAGFIGAHTCKALARAGFLPVAFDNLSTGHRDAVRYGPLLPGDVRDAAAVEHALRAYRIEAVIHFAASAYFGESMENPGPYYDNNLGGMIALINACHATGLDRIIFSSSCAIYGTADTFPLAETAPQNPINPYGRTKLICENMLADHAAAHGLRYAALRYCDAAGADPEGELFERHEPETHLLPLALRAATGQGPALQVFGSDYPTPDGTCVRDYLHVCDLARAHVLALRYLLDGGETLRLNLGTGRGLSVRQIITSIEAMTGRQLPVIWSPRRPGEPSALVVDPSAARDRLGFVAEQSDLATLLTDAALVYGLRNAA